MIDTISLPRPHFLKKWGFPENRKACVFIQHGEIEGYGITTFELGNIIMGKPTLTL